MDIKNLISSYASWLKQETTFEKIGSYYEITTPFLDSANDNIQIYVRQEDGYVIFSDDGYTLNSLTMQGISLSKTRKNLIENILRQYGTNLSGNELTTIAKEEEFALKKHMFIQSIIRVDDMFMMTRENIASTFQDDVKKYLDDNSIYYTENIQFVGRTGYTYQYDYVFQRSRMKPTIYLLVLNSPSQNSVGSTLFSWDDTKGNRHEESQLIVIMNDKNKAAALDARKAIQEYEAKVILWSEREKAENIDILSA